MLPALFVALQTYQPWFARSAPTIINPALEMTIPSPFTTFPSLYHVIFVLGVEGEQPSKAELVSLTVTLVGVWRNLGGAKEKRKMQ